MKKRLVKALGIVASILVFLGLLLLNSFYWAPLGAVRSWLTSPNELGRFGWEALTGPPAAGALAVAAALIAFTGLTRQVAEAKRDNDITALKNDVDQWWSTLQWAYTEAKTFTEKAEKEASKKGGILARLRSLTRPDTVTTPQTTKETKAIIAILASLAKHEGPQQEGLSAQQKTTVAEVLGMFRAPEDQSDVDEVLIDLGRTSSVRSGPPPHVQETMVRGVQYEQDVIAALRGVDPQIGTLESPGGMRRGLGDVGYDGIIRTTSDRLIAIEAKYRQMNPLDRRQLAATLGLLPDDGGERKVRSRGSTALSIDKVLIVANTPLTSSAKEFVLRQSRRMGYVRWNAGDSVDEIQRELKRLAEED